MGLSETVKKETIPFFECSDCKRRLEEGEFIAVIGKTPSTGLSIPSGRADVILKKLKKYIVNTVLRNYLKCLK
jgi:hypothetical protein